MQLQGMYTRSRTVKIFWKWSPIELGRFKVFENSRSN